MYGFKSANWLTGPGRPLTRFGQAPQFREGLWRLAQDTYAWMVPNGSWGETNLGLIQCGKHSVLIDTCWDLGYTREMLDACQPVLSEAPIDTVINTHADGDHCWGNQLFKDRHIVASQACIDQMHHYHPRSLHALKHAGRVLQYLPVCGIHHFGQYMHRMFEPYDFRGIQITVPQQGFSSQRVLRVNGVELVLIEMGPAHTDGDLIVHVPERRVAYCGDLLFVGVTPVMWAGPVGALTTGLHSLKQMDVDVLVPGHGPLATRQDVQTVIDYWHCMQDQVRACFLRGMTPMEAATSILLGADFARRPWAHWDAPERLLTNATTMYRHWGAKLTQLPGKLGPMNLMRQQAQLADAFYRVRGRTA